MLTTTTTLALLLTACGTPLEQGIDRSTISGTVTLTPMLIDEGEAEQGANDELAGEDPDGEKGPLEAPVATDLGFIGGQVVKVGATMLDFGVTLDGGGAGASSIPDGDLDWYRFLTLAEGTLNLTLAWEGEEAPDTGDSNGRENAIYTLEVHDLDTLDEEGAPTLLVEGTSEESWGSHSVSFDVVPGANYAIFVGGRLNRGEVDAYSLTLSGFDPNDDRYVVGAYTGATLEDRGALVGGTTVSGFTLDADSLSWVGDYSMTYLRTVSEEAIAAEPKGGLGGGSVDSGSPDTGGGDDHGGDDQSGDDQGGDDQGGDGADDGATDDGGEGADTGDTGIEPGGDDGEAAGDDGGDAGGDDGAAEEPETQILVTEGASTVYLFAGNFGSLNSGLTSGTHHSTTATEVTLAGQTAAGVAVAVDKIQPRTYGWTAVDAEPNNADFDPGSELIIGGFENAQVLPLATGIGTVDTITGVLDYLTDDPTYEGEVDTFAITVPETMGAYIVSSFAEGYNLDVNLYDGAGVDLAKGWAMGDTNPEIIDSAAWEFTFEAGETYYLIVLPWSGVAGPVDYGIELEWLAP